MSGQRFGRLTVLGRDGTYLKNRCAMWRCRCDCGNLTVVIGTSLRKGTTRSCGCLSKEMTHERFSLPEGEAAFNAVYHSYKTNVKRRGFVFELSKKFFRRLTRMPCFYCGTEPNNICDWFRKMNGNYVYSGLDRIDNEIGYIPDNVVPCCKKCNMVKAGMSVEEFLRYIQRIVECSGQKMKSLIIRIA